MDLRRSMFTIALTFAVASTIAMLGWKFFYRPEPTYKGKPLSAWAEQYGSNHWTGGTATSRAASQEAEFAVRQIGTNGIPFLLKLMRARDSALKKKLRTIVPQTWRQTKLRLRDRSGEIRRVGAHGLAALGTNAPAAVPALIELATNHPEDDGRYIAVFALRTLGSAAEPAIPFLIQCLTNKINIIRDDAALGLGYMHRRPEIAVPALIQCLDLARSSKNTFECADVISSLGEFGTNAKASVPILLGLLNHSDSYVRSRVTNSLSLIDSDAATKVIGKINRFP